MGIVVNIIYSQIRRKTKCKFLLFSMKYIFDLICDDHHNDLCCCLAVPFLFLFFLSAPPAFALNLQLSNWYLELIIFMVMVMMVMVRVMIVMLINTMLVMVMVMIVILADDGEGGNLNSDSLYALQHHLLQPEAATRCVRAPERVLMKITILIIV